MYGCGMGCPILIPFRLPQISYFTFSLKCFSSVSNGCPDVGIGPLHQFPYALRAGPALLTPVYTPPTVPSFYQVLCGSIYCFLLVSYSCPLSDGVLHALLCLKVYSRCIQGERCNPCPPTLPPSCSLLNRYLLYLVFQKEALDLNKSFVKSELFIFSTGLLYAEL